MGSISKIRRTRAKLGKCSTCGEDLPSDYAYVTCPTCRAISRMHNRNHRIYKELSDLIDKQRPPHVSVEAAPILQPHYVGMEDGSKSIGHRTL